MNVSFLPSRFTDYSTKGKTLIDQGKLRISHDIFPIWPRTTAQGASTANNAQYPMLHHKTKSSTYIFFISHNIEQDNGHSPGRYCWSGPQIWILKLPTCKTYMHTRIPTLKVQVFAFEDSKNAHDQIRDQTPLLTCTVVLHVSICDCMQPSRKTSKQPCQYPASSTPDTGRDEQEFGLLERQTSLQNSCPRLEVLATSIFSYYSHSIFSRWSESSQQRRPKCQRDTLGRDNFAGQCCDTASYYVSHSDTIYDSASYTQSHIHTADTYIHTVLFLPRSAEKWWQLSDPSCRSGVDEREWFC